MNLESSGMTYLNDACVMPFCKGCGHTHVVRQLNEALVRLQLDPSNVCLVTDIGCIGLADGLFPTVHTVHTTHGRSTAFATGIELADSVLNDSKLKVVVLIGDGGAMIGLLHLVEASLLDVDLTVLLCNNLLFGMTGGQHSALSPLEFVTATSPRGNFTPPMDVCKVVESAHAKFIARSLATDKDLSALIADAIHHEGFSLVEIVELCTEYGTKRNQLSGNELRRIVEANGARFGILRNEATSSEFGSLYAEKFPKPDNQDGRIRASVGSENERLTVEFPHHLEKKVGIVVAGSAGERVQSSASRFCQAAVRSGLYCTQKNDNPVTQGTGFSFSEICISPAEILYTGIVRPDVVVLVSSDGVREAVGKHLFDSLSPSALVIVDRELDIPETSAEVLTVPLRSMCGAKKAAAGALAIYLEHSNVFPGQALLKVLEGGTPSQEHYFPPVFYEYLDSLRKEALNG